MPDCSGRSARSAGTSPPTWSTSTPSSPPGKGFNDPELAKLFATAETGDNGQFLGGDPSFVQYDEAIIDNLAMPMEVVYAGSEEAILASPDAAYNRKAPILIYLWTPHSAHNKYDLTEVEAARLTATTCTARHPTVSTATIRADELFKIVSKDLATTSPAVNTFLTNMNYTTADQVEMLGVGRDRRQVGRRRGRSVDRGPRGHLEGVARLSHSTTMDSRPAQPVRERPCRSIYRWPAVEDLRR